ncbi:hypothetical protein [Bradyrhizobium sp. USDA 4504]
MRDRYVCVEIMGGLSNTTANFGAANSDLPVDPLMRASLLGSGGRFDVEPECLGDRDCGVERGDRHGRADRPADQS